MASTFVLVFLFAQPASAHRQPVHQYIAREGYLLLRTTYGQDIPALAGSLGTVDPSAAGDSAWQKGFVTTGAWREDDEDVVYHQDILPGWNYALTSITHFWSADRGDYTPNLIRLQKDQPPLPPLTADIGPFPTAFAKMMKFADGGWVLNYPRTLLCRNSANGHWLAVTPVVSGAGFGVPLSYDTLTAFYRTEKLAVHAEQPNLCAVFDVNDLKTIDLSSVAEIQVTDEVRDIIVWEVLGRMCHLLADMSVPAHAHLDEHGLNPDSYEDYVGGPGDPYRAWSAENAGPAVILNLSGSRVLHFLMYVMQQQADHFGSNGPADGNGNDDIGGDATSVERGFLTALNLGSLGGPTTDAGPWSEAQLKTIRDRTLPFAIRATAGLFYWFCRSTGMISPLPSTVTEVSERIEPVPAAARLWQNYPNPFNPSTTIRYALPRRSAVQLTIYTVLGQLVTRLVNQTQSEGEHDVMFDARGLPSGVYFYKLWVGDFSQTRSFVVLR